MEQQLIFVYNAKSGFVHAVTDLIKKSASPKTYPCKLCQITYSGATMNKIWKNYIASLNIPSVFLHKNEFEQAYPNMVIKYPAVLLKDANSVKMIVSSGDFDKVSDLGELMKQINERLQNA